MRIRGWAVKFQGVYARLNGTTWNTESETEAMPKTKHSPNVILMHCTYVLR